MKKYYIIGGGLYGCLLAYQLATHFPQIEIHVVEGNDHLIPAFDPITLGGFSLNNGFHGMELPRAQGLARFLSETVQLPLWVGPNQRGLFIQGHLVPFEAVRQEWPAALQAAFGGESALVSTNGDDLLGAAGTAYQTFLKQLGTRYSSHFSDIQGLLVPWFFPADYSLESGDEGDRFRNQVRSRQLIAQYAYPEGQTFAAIQAPITTFLQGLGVKFHFSTRVSFQATGLTFSGPEGEMFHTSQADQLFFCASSALILKDIAPELFRGLIRNKRRFANALLALPKTLPTPLFSEILCADLDFPLLTRVSSPTAVGLITDSERQFWQVELCLPADEDVTDSKLQIQLSEQLAKVLGVSVADVTLVDIKLTRDVYFPEHHLLQQANHCLADWQQTVPHLRLRPSFGPINMAKAWLFAEADVMSIERGKGHE